MGVEAIDRILAEWEERLRRIDESLLALEAEPTYQMLAPRSSPRMPLRGETARIVSPALDALGELFEHRGRLTEVLDRAKDVRASMSAFWGNDDKEREIVLLLEGPSIELPPEATPLGRRALLDPGARDVRIVPQQLLAAMAAAFESARDAVVAVKQAWERTEIATSDVERQVRDARAAAASLGVDAAAEADLSDVERELEAVKSRVAADPLGASSDVVARMVPRVASVVARLGELSAQRARVEQALAGAQEVLARMRAARAAAVVAVDAMPREVAGAHAPGTPSQDGLAESLVPWLAKIEETARAGRWHPAEVGLARWNDTARAAVANDERIAGALSAVIARRDELAGRLSARRAQAAALAARGVVLDASLQDVAREAEKLLAQRPTRLAHANALVDRYDEGVSLCSR
jgi:hypothetical protein